MKKMNKWERVKSALHGEEVDRVPISLWKHYHLQDRAPGQLAEVSLALHRQFDTDLVKLTPSGLYPIQDWGATIRFGTDDDDLPKLVKPVVASAEEWENLPRLDVNKGVLRWTHCNILAREHLLPPLLFLDPKGKVKTCSLFFNEIMLSQKGHR